MKRTHARQRLQPYYTETAFTVAQAWIDEAGIEAPLDGDEDALVESLASLLEKYAALPRTGNDGGRDV